MNESILYRYERLHQFVDMLKTNTIWLSTPAKWQDPYEKACLFAKISVLHGLVEIEDGCFFSSGVPRFPHSRTRHWSRENCLGHRIFSMCFTTTIDSERMWMAARAENRICWSVKVDVLLNQVFQSSDFENISLETVEYRTTEEVNAVHSAYAKEYAGGFPFPSKKDWWENWRNAVLLPIRTKRCEFADEKEKRLVVLDRTHDVIKGRDGVKIIVPLRDLIQEVRVDPSSALSELHLIQDKLRSVGYLGLVSRSTLYEPPMFDIITEKPIQK